MAVTADLPSGIAVVVGDDGWSRLLDVSCSECSSCGDGSPQWCETPRASEAEILRFRTSDADSQPLEHLLLASAVLSADLAGDELVLVLTDQPGDAAGRLIRLVHAGGIVCTTDPLDARIRDEIAEARPIGRADVVATCQDVRSAVRSVARGGTVCMAGTSESGVTVTELVQREVRLVGPGDIRAVVERAGRTTVEEQLATA